MPKRILVAEPNDYLSDSLVGLFNTPTPGKVLKDMLKDKVQKDFVFRPVSKAVNKVENNSADLIKEA